MATIAEQGIATDSVLLRLIYEPPTFREGDAWQPGTWLAPRRSPLPVLLWASASLNHANEYLTASTILARLGPESTTPLPDPPSDVLSISMQSPLVILVPLLLPQVVGYGWALIKLAERICTFGPRVSRRRQEDLLAPLPHGHNDKNSTARQTLSLG